jgi:hypothetical protein
MSEPLPEVPELSLGRAPQELIDYFEHVYLEREKLTAELMRVADRMHGSARVSEQEFVGDELALLMNCHPETGGAFVAKSVLACSIPQLMASMETGELTERHVHAASDELHSSLSNPDDREAVLHTVLERCRVRVSTPGRRWPFPGELRRMLRKEALQFDQAAADRRRERTRRDREVSATPLPDGAVNLAITGPAEQTGAMYEAIDAFAGTLAGPGDERTRDQLRYDAAFALLTGTRPGSDGSEMPAMHGQIIVPISTALGADVELGELVGYGPLLPSTTRELLAHAEAVQRVLVDAATGQVIGVDDPEPYDLEPLDWMLTQPASIPYPRTDPDGNTTISGCAPHGRREGPGAYRPTPRLIRLVKTRDRTCRFPGCRRHARSCDVDHPVPYPLGATEPCNLHCLRLLHECSRCRGMSPGRDSTRSRSLRRGGLGGASGGCGRCRSGAIRCSLRAGCEGQSVGNRGWL